MCDYLDHLLPLWPEQHLDTQINSAAAEEGTLTLGGGDDASGNEIFCCGRRCDGVHCLASMESLSSKMAQKKKEKTGICQRRNQNRVSFRQR